MWTTIRNLSHSHMLLRNVFWVKKSGECLFFSSNFWLHSKKLKWISRWISIVPWKCYFSSPYYRFMEMKMKKKTFAADRCDVGVNISCLDCTWRRKLNSPPKNEISFPRISWVKCAFFLQHFTCKKTLLLCSNENSEVMNLFSSSLLKW